MKEVRTTMPASAKSLATSETLRMFSSLSSGLKLRFLFRPAHNSWKIWRESEFEFTNYMYVYQCSVPICVLTLPTIIVILQVV